MRGKDTARYAIDICIIELLNIDSNRLIVDGKHDPFAEMRNIKMYLSAFLREASLSITVKRRN